MSKELSQRERVLKTIATLSEKADVEKDLGISAIKEFINQQDGHYSTEATGVMGDEDILEIAAGYLHRRGKPSFIAHVLLSEFLRKLNEAEEDHE